MSSSLLIVLLVVIWLLVLLPMVVNTKEPVRRVSTAFSETRVLHRGSDKKLTPRTVRRPRPLGEDDERLHSGDDDESDKDVEAPSAKKVTVMAARTSSETIHASMPCDDGGLFTIEGDTILSSVFENPLVSSEAPTEEIVITPELLEGSLEAFTTDNPLAKTPDDSAADTDASDDSAVDAKAPEEVTEAEKVVTEEPVAVDEDYPNLGDDSDTEVEDFYAADDDDITLDGSGDFDHVTDNDSDVEDTADTDTPSASTPTGAKVTLANLGGALAGIIAGMKRTERGIPTPAEPVTVDPADIAYAQRRQGRGGFDPVADQKAAQKRYKRRQIIFLVLLAVLLPLIGVAAFLGGAVWAAPAAWAVVIGLFLMALRSQVRLEKQLRQRRLATMHRSRALRDQYGDEDGYSAETPMNGTYTMVDIDDGDPLFDQLDTEPFMEEFLAGQDEEFTYDDGGYLRDQFGRVRITASRYPEGGTAATTPSYRHDPYAEGDYQGDVSRDYWAEEETAHSVAQFRMPVGGGYRDVG